MGKPIAVKGEGICFAFPDVCNTPTPGGPVPVPYPNTGKLIDITGTIPTVLAGGKEIITEKCLIPDGMTVGDEAGSTGGVTSGMTKGEVKFATFSMTVRIGGSGAVRIFDSTTQNKGNAVGQVMAGAPTVLVGD